MRPDLATARLLSRQLPTTKTHVGILVPWGNMIVEDELPRTGLDTVVFHYARLVPARRYRDSADFLAEIAAAVPPTLGQFARLPLAGVLVACTSVGFLTPEAYADNPVVDAFTAILDALTQLDAKRIVLATPYPIAHTAKQAAAFAAAGVQVCGHASLDLGLLDDFAGVTTDRVAALVDGIGSGRLAEADAVVLSCTAWPTLAAITTQEDHLGKPVLSSNLALAISAAGMGQPRRINDDRSGHAHQHPAAGELHRPGRTAQRRAT
jgi:maleate isomerase